MYKFEIEVRKCQNSKMKLTNVTFAVNPMLNPMLAINTTAAIADNFTLSTYIMPNN